MKNALYLVLLMLSLDACTRTSKNLQQVKSNGFIIADNSEHWIFLPVKAISSKECLSDFNSANLHYGFSFSPSSCPNVSYVKRTLDTLHIETRNPEISGNLLMITPVSIEYEVNGTEKEKSDLTSDFAAKINGQLVQFSYDISSVRLISVTPLFCAGKSSSDVTECKCEHSDDDKDDYLFKICEYIKKQDRFSDLPCKYKIKSVSLKTVDDKEMIRVELNCCYLGDVAYFDKETKDLIRISYGAK